MKNFNSLIRKSNNSVANYGNETATRRQRYGNESLLKRLCVTILTLLTLGVGQMWGWGFSGDNFIYFHNKGGWSDSGKMLFIGKNSYTTVYTMSAVTGNSSLWVVKISNAGWSDATYMAVAGGGSVWGSGNWGPSNRTNATHYTNTYTSGLDASNNQRYILIPGSTSNNASLSLTYLGTNDPNYTITVKAKVSTDGGSTYSEATSPGTLSASSKKFTAYNSCNSATSLSSGTITCGYLASTTLTAADATGYDFVGWYNSSGTQQTTSKTLTINPTENATYYAYYKEKRYSLTFSHNGHGSIAVGGSTVASGSTAYVNYSTTKTLVATPNTGYNFSGWTKSGSNTGSVTIGNASNASTTIKATNTGATITAGFTPKTTTITLNNADATTAGTTEVTATYDATIPTITIPTKTGYTFGGYWGAPGGTGPKYINADGTGNGTWQNEESTYTLYAAWAENKSTITLVASPSGKGTFQVGGSTVTSTTAGVTTTREVTAVPIAGYSFSGWSITGGATISSTTDNPTTVTGGGAGTAATLTATFVENPTYYLLKFGTRSGETSNGSVAAKDGSNNPLTSNTEYLSGTSVTVTATAADDYKFDSWYHGWSTGSSFSTVNPLTFTLTEATNVYAHFVQKTTSITLNKNGGSGGTAGPVTATHGSTTLSTNPLVLPGKTGYTCTGYWTESSGGTKVIDTDGKLIASVSGYTKSGNKEWDYDDPTLTLYAQYTENMTTVTINVSPASTGTLTVGGAAFTPGNTTTAGKTTSRTVVATAANDYAFSSWSVTGEATGTASTNTYTLKGSGNGSTGTLTANFTPIPCKLYKLSAAKNGSTTDKGAMTYDATEHAYYKDITTDASPYYFRFYYNSSAQYCTDWSSKAGGDAYTSGKQITANDSKVACDQSVGGWGDKPAMYYPGESGTSIRIWFDFQNKKVWITADKDKQYVLRGANADNTSLAHGMPGWNATTSYFDGLASGNTGTYAATLNADEWYHLKVYDMYNSTWYGTTGAEAQLNDGVYGTMGSGNDFYFHTTIAGSYTFTLDKSSGTKIKIDFPASYQLNYLIGSVAGTSGSISSSPSTDSGSYVSSGNSVTLTAPAAMTGYTWKGWYTNAAGTEGKIDDTNRAITVTMNADKTLYACYTENSYNVTVSAGANGSVSPSGTVAIKQISGTELTATPNTGYYLTEWTKEGSAITLSPSATANPVTAKTTAGGAGYSITANFASQWAWASDKNEWSTSANVLGNYSISSGKTSGYVDVTLAANTRYSFKFVDVKNDTWYGPSSNTEITYANKGTAQTMSNTAGGGANQTIMTGAPGTYRFTWNITDKKVTVTYPTGYTVTFSANTLSGTGDGASSAPTATYNSGATSVTSGDYVPASTSVTFTAAAAKSGYTFNGWYTATTGGTKKSSNLSYSETITANTTRYARYTQYTHTVTLTNQNSTRGTVNTSSPLTVGEAEAVQIQATPNTGYMFNGWVKTTGGTATYYTGAGPGQVVDAGGASKQLTYITASANLTLQATWDEDRSSGYFVHYGNDGKNADGGSDPSQTRSWADGNLYKRSGETAGTVSYWTFTAGAGDVTKVIEFKVLEGDPADIGSATWYGYNSASGGKITASISNKTLSTSYGNGRLVIVTPGDYLFKWDSSTKQLSITYPAGNYVRGGFNSWGWTDEMSGSGPWTATINLPADTYYSGEDGFKYVIGGTHYGKNSTTITSASASASSCSASGANINLATTIGGNYTFTVNNAKTQVTVTYPTIPAMTGTLGLTVTGARGGSGTELNPYSVYEGDEITLSKTHSSAPANDSHFKYTYYEGAKNASTATTELATRVSTADNTSYTFTVNQDIGKYPLKVAAYYEYGPEGYKVKGTALESGIVYFRVHLAPGVELTADKVSITDGQSVTLTATPNHLEVHSINVKYEFFRGNSTATVDKISETTKTVTADDAPTATQDVTSYCTGNANSWTFTVRMTYLGIEKTATVTVYRKWNIYVDDAASCNWGAIYLYMWDAGGTYPTAFPGDAQPKVSGSTHWYTVTLDTRYPNFKLSKQSGTESNNHTASISTYPEGTYWYLNNCQTLTQLTLTNPTVTLSASVANCKDITLSGNVSNFGGDGLAASRLKSVKFIVEGSDQAATTVSTSNGTFSVTLTNATAGATNTLQAYAENIYGSATSAVLRYSNVTLDLQGGTGGTTAVTAVQGMSMPAGATAPTKEGYKFGGYYANTNGSGKQYYSASMTSVNTWDKTTQNVILYAKWTLKETYNVYFYNKDNWATPKAYMWQNGSSPLIKNAAWPGEAMTVHQGSVYKLDYESADGYDRIIFSDNGAAARRTGDLTLPATNSWFFNPEDSLTANNGWTRYIMVANYPTEKQVAVVGEKKSIDPVVAWAEGIGFNQINITAARDSGSSAITATIAGTKIIATSSAAGTAKFIITYRYSSTTITKVVRFQFLEGLTVQAKINTADAKWEDSGKVKIHYWGNAAGDPTGDITMSYLKLEGDEYYFQALVPKGSNGYANFLFFYDYMEDTDANRWRQTADQTANTEKCYTISYAGQTKNKSNCTSVANLCATSWQLRIIMGSGDIYTSNSVTSSEDIVSFFAPANKSGDPSYRKGTISLEYNGATVHTYSTSLVSESGVYTAKITTTSPYTLTDITPYAGNYYIRTDPSAGGWDNYLTTPSNKLTKFTRNENFPNETFSYYWVDNVAKTSGGSGTVNIKATVANDYNPVLCSFSADENVAREEHGLNLRFGYEPTTNDLIRGILRGATFNDFLNLVGSTDNIYKEITCDTLFNDDFYNTSDNFKGKCKLQDKSNWVYEIIAYAKIDNTHPIADVVLKSYYNGIHYLLGMVQDSYGRDTSTPVSFPLINTGTTNGIYGLRVIYDFKTNRLFGAWAPADRVVDGILNVDADIMFLRHEDGDVAQIGFTTTNPTTNKITDLNHAIFAFELDNDKSKNMERHYFLSLPFDCQVGNIFGIGGYMEYWGIQCYRGDLRAKNGWFKETSTFWEWLDTSDTLKAGEGYLLSVDKKALQNDGVWKEGIIYQTQEAVLDDKGDTIKTADGLSDSIVWVTHTDGSLLTLYFPSTTSGFEIKPAAGPELIISYPELECKITRDDRNLYDSNWRCIGTPGYKNITVYTWDSIGSNYTPDTIPPRFLYEFHEQTTSATYAKGTYKAVDGSTFTYHSFNSYMVQYAGTINWNVYSKGEVAPAPLRRHPLTETTATRLQLDLLNDEGAELDRTFVWLQDGATLGYDKNFDLNKIVESSSNQIYSLAEHNAPYAANVLPLEIDTVALVVNITKAGEFTFSLPKDKHSGLVPILYDMYENVQTNLLADDYTVALKKGKYTGRFYIIFQASEPVATSFESTSDGGQKVLSDEAIYDALGRRVNTVYPGLLYIVNGEKRIAK